MVSALGDANALLYKGEKGDIAIIKNTVTDVGLISLNRVEPTVDTEPVANIIRPLGGTFVSGDEIIFEGSGEDPEDGQLSGSHLQWGSDIDGSIGQGTRFVRSDLSAGVHTITLKVTNNDGVVDTTTTRITIWSPDNSIGMQFRLIPKGTFTMGSPEDEPGRYPNETQHEVTLTRSFYIQTTEVTQGQ